MIQVTVVLETYKICIEPPKSQDGRSLKPLYFTVFTGITLICHYFFLGSIYWVWLWYFVLSIPLCVQKYLVFLKIQVIRFFSSSNESYCLLISSTSYLEAKVPHIKVLISDKVFFSHRIWFLMESSLCWNSSSFTLILNILNMQI